MKVLKHVMGDIEVTKDLLLLLTIGGLYALSIALSNTFVNVYLWKQTGEFADIGIYNLSVVISQPLTFILAGRWAKKMDRVIVLRIGVIFLALFYITVLFLGQNAGHLLILLGALLGIGFGFYWLAFNVLTFEITEPDTRDFFNGFLGLLTSFAGMIGPIFAGFVISSLESYTGYKIIFGVSLLLFFAAVILSFFLKRRSAKGNFSFMRVFNERKSNSDWLNVLHAHFFQGLREGTFIFIIAVLVFITTGSELAIGTFGLVNSAVSFLVYYLATRLIKPRFRIKAILYAGTMLYLSVFILTLDLTFPRLLIYGICISIAYPIFFVPYVSLTYDVIGKAWNAAEMRIEYIVVREVYLNLGRIVSITIFLIAISISKDTEIVPFLLLILGIGHSVIYLFYRKLKIVKAFNEKSASKPAQ
ncbi:MFS transporter [Guptibacillus algicola]|uniref:MFS transporter n=1 Tax=Guptibacillus algicola TaxID=225844 RepID=UPI001CD237C5|nr:MFS transporter [Alkalihalobacillus algicola]MCA0986049.1 MFS transporter [Alkalihalobacillus algicola]